MRRRALTSKPPEWTNWARSARATPAAVATPHSEDELVALVRAHTAAGGRVKVVGGSHSFTPIAAPDLENTLLISLDGIQGITHVDVITGEVSVLGGTRLWTLADALEPYGLALPNMGDIDHQSLAGALSTGTHGTGLGFTGYSGMLTSLRLLLASGQVVTVSRSQDPELFEAARVGLGAMGIILEATLRCVPSFDLAAAEHPESLEGMLTSFVDRSRTEDHLEFYWFQHTDMVSAKVNTRRPMGGERAPLKRAQHLVDDEILGNGGHRALCELGRILPRTVPRLNRFAASAMGDRDYVDRSDRIFVSPRRTRFREMEYAVPLADAEEVLREVIRVVNGYRDGITFPIEVRTAAADNTWLGTASGRDSAYIAVHRFIKEDHLHYFAAVEPVFKAAGGRPHWGKIHTLNAQDLAGLYPHHADAVRTRDRVDPTGRFSNRYLETVLGPPPS
ncbi:MAG: D-arabinono-1,4-lactone oxidase [Galactobacter sp.]|uniref:D-arabinono-1,4-lactone oxidase n=1 Tax=Galactobacter sp. TaxID=2676125 RepID=UPI0025BF70C2|nr:D-arabinono-1,4-lactone oxidase [Galactobacter sp.]